MDLFNRHVHRDLRLKAAFLVAVISVCAMNIFGAMVLIENFLTDVMATSLMLDENAHPQIRFNFNITLLDLRCDYVLLSVWDALGTYQHNLTEHIDKWQLDDTGARCIFSEREMLAFEHEEHEKSLEELYADGVNATDLTKENWGHFMQENEMAFVVFLLPWSTWSQRLLPDWEKFARAVEVAKMPVGVAKVDCVAQADVCQEQRIVGFPTLRWYHSAEPIFPDYKMDRTVQALMGSAELNLGMYEKFVEWDKRGDNQNDNVQSERKRKLFQQNQPKHRGCQVSGYLMVNDVPGNLQVESRSNDNFDMANLSHTVNHLSFGEPMGENDRKWKHILQRIPDQHRPFAPMDASSYITSELYQAHQHYIKVVPTQVHFGSLSAHSAMTYELMAEPSQGVHYGVNTTPEVHFSHDMGPMSIVVVEEEVGQGWTNM